MATITAAFSRIGIQCNFEPPKHHSSINFSLSISSPNFTRHKLSSHTMPVNSFRANASSAIVEGEQYATFPLLFPSLKNVTEGTTLPLWESSPILLLDTVKLALFAYAFAVITVELEVQKRLRSSCSLRINLNTRHRDYA